MNVLALDPGLILAEAARLRETGVSVRDVASIPRDGNDWLYFIQQSMDGPVKIGVAKDPRARLSALQMGNPERLHLVIAAPGAGALEKQIHADLRRHHLGGEWFDGDAALAYSVEHLGVPVSALERIGYEVSGWPA